MNRLIVVLFLLSINLNAQDLESFFTQTNDFLSKNVKDGKVDYHSIKKDIKTLDKIIALSNDLVLENINDNQYKAFWINIYNLCVIKGITNNLKINSPLDVNGFFDTITYQVGRKKIALNDIENKLLRDKYNDPRFHFVLVCGAIGCPVLLNEAYMPNTIDQQLEAQTTKAVNNSEFIKINRKKKRIEVSEIFKWYKKDFVMNGTEIDFINKYLKEPVSSKFKLSYYSYNWKLNIKKD
ncbi:DUF547 domain-containing protein [Winogradskyella sp.]|uniref:DUF547 domain-containing protein n=1 Tax=Winogradskyella sp. TaxID=1883156 RepID=UPI0025EC4EBA|nr:DUF547 domain-containing protein [Winogradskyella sp.]